MILSPRAVSVLQNFQTINQAIHILPGREIKTMAPTGSMFASATVSDEFPKEFAIFDLARFLGLMSLSKQSEIEFFDNHLVMMQGTSKVKYGYCSTKVIQSAAEKKMKALEAVETFDLSSDTLQSVIKAMNILGYSEIAFVGQDGVLSVQAVCTKNVSADTYSTEIGRTEKNFTAIIESDKFKLMNENYTVHVSEHLAHFQTKFDDGSLDYWIALSEKSEF